MAKLTAGAILFFLFASALALTPPENDESAAAAANTKVALPSSDEINPLTDKVKDENSAAAKLPIGDTFRPINRRFHVRRSKHVRSHHLVDTTARGIVEIPYGNDMVVPSGENSDFNGVSETIEIGGRQRVKPHRHHRHKDDHADSDSDSDSDDDDDDRISKKMVRKRFDHHRLDRKELKELKKMRQNFRFQKEKEEKLGFMNRVRRFFDHYF